MTSYLVADLYAVWAGEQHPARPKVKASGPSRYAALRSRLEAQRARTEASSAAPEPPV